jgi:hypothetical protein
MSPQRVQRKRTKGWRMPENTVSVCRPGRWGNPWRVGSTAWTIGAGGYIDREPHGPLTAEECIESFRHGIEHHLEGVPDYLAELRGKDLACWCRLDQPCHADVLLELANSEAGK